MRSRISVWLKRHESYKWLMPFYIHGILRYLKTIYDPMRLHSFGVIGVKEKATSVLISYEGEKLAS